MANALQTTVFTLTAEMVKELLEADKQVTAIYENGDVITIKYESGTYHPHGYIKYLTVFYGEMNVEDKEVQYYREGSCFYAVDHVDKAVNAFLDRTKSDTPKVPVDGGESFEYINTRASKVIHYDSHYTYIDKVGPYLLAQLTGKPVDECKTLVKELSMNRGKSAYDYYDSFIKGMVPFNHGSLVLMLTYTDEFKSTPVEMTLAWVIENYHIKYAPMIEKAEKQLLDETYLAY